LLLCQLQLPFYRNSSSEFSPSSTANKAAAPAAGATGAAGASLAAAENACPLAHTNAADASQHLRTMMVEQHKPCQWLVGLHEQELRGEQTSAWDTLSYRIQVACRNMLETIS
jgi:hypothetical protein